MSHFCWLLTFSSVDFADVKLIARAWEESVNLEVFVYNPSGTGHDPNTGYNTVPDASDLMDHHHAWDHDLSLNHKHDDDHEREPHNHDPLHFHGKGAEDHDHKSHHHHVHNPTDEHQHHHDDHDDHHGHHDDDDHDDDSRHGHHGHYSHEHDDDDDDDDDDDEDHHHHQGALENDDHLLIHNHPDEHHHHGHHEDLNHQHDDDDDDHHEHDHENFLGHDHDHDHHHGEETVSFFLSKEDLAYLSLPSTTALKIKVIATVFPDPDHHHHVEDHDGPQPSEDEDDDDKRHDHVHHDMRLNKTAFNLQTDQIKFTLGGPANTDLRPVAVGTQAEPLVNPVITLGTVLSGDSNDLRLDDTSFLTIQSENVPKPHEEDEDDEDDDFTHVVEFEATSADFVFSRIDTISVPVILQTNTSKKVKIRMFVFNPEASGHAALGYSVASDRFKILKVDKIDRSFALEVPREDIEYLNREFVNTQEPISIKIKIRATVDKPFQLSVDMLNFIATTTDTQNQPVRVGIQEYIDPGLRDPAMRVIPHKTGFLLKVNNLQPGLMNVNWAFEPHVHLPPTGCSGVTRIVLKYTGPGASVIKVFLKSNLLATF